jgi:hypothetical protein
LKSDFCYSDEINLLPVKRERWIHWQFLIERQRLHIRNQGSSLSPDYQKRIQGHIFWAFAITTTKPFFMSIEHYGDSLIHPLMNRQAQPCWFFVKPVIT